MPLPAGVIRYSTSWSLIASTSASIGSILSLLVGGEFLGTATNPLTIFVAEPNYSASARDSLILVTVFLIPSVCQRMLFPLAAYIIVSLRESNCAWTMKFGKVIQSTA